MEEDKKRIMELLELYQDGELIRLVLRFIKRYVGIT